MISSKIVSLLMRGSCKIRVYFVLAILDLLDSLDMLLDEINCYFLNTAVRGGLKRSAMDYGDSYSRFQLGWVDALIFSIRVIKTDFEFYFNFSLIVLILIIIIRERFKMSL